MVTRRRTSHALWTSISNQAWHGSHLISGTSPILLINCGGYRHYLPLPSSDSECILVIYQHSTWGRDYSMLGVSQLTRDTGTTYGRLLLSYLVNSGLNAFIFNESHYLQIHGTAMGTHMAPSWGNWDMSSCQPKEKIAWVWWRYIDDIFAIWTHGELPLQALLRILTVTTLPSNLLLPGLPNN